MPVLPLVASAIRIPRRSRPLRSPSRIMYSAGRSGAIRSSRSSGVLPTRSIADERRSNASISTVLAEKMLLTLFKLGAGLVVAILNDGGLERAKRQRRAARARADDLAAQLVDHIVEVHLVDLGERPALDHLGQDRRGGLADRAAAALERQALNPVAGVVDLEIDRHDVAAAGVAARHRHIRILQ